MNKRVDYIKWNNVLAFFISIGAALTLFMLITEGLDLFEAIWMTLVLSGIVFGLFGRFYSSLGALIKVSAILSIGIFLLYMTRDTKDEQVLMIVRVVVIFMTLAAIIAHLIFFYLINRRKQLVENGWLVKTVVTSVLHESADEGFQNTRLVTSGIHPETGRECQFKSQLIYGTADNDLSVGDTVNVYVDKNNDSKYFMDLSEINDDGLCL